MGLTNPELFLLAKSSTKTILLLKIPGQMAVADITPFVKLGFRDFILLQNIL
jgi:hypothetical protein